MAVLKTMQVSFEQAKDESPTSTLLSIPKQLSTEITPVVDPIISVPVMT